MCNYIKRKISQKIGLPNSRAGSDHSLNTSDDDRIVTDCTRYQVASAQSTGQERQINEDSLFTMSSVLGGVDGPISFGIFMVADGMGGHQSGELASRLASQAASQFLIEGIFTAVGEKGRMLGDADCLALVKGAVDEAQNLIRQSVPGGGTTLTFALAVGNRFFTGHVGDSRLYLLGRDGKLRLITRDHSLVRRLVDLGEIKANEASNHPQRNVLYRALGQTDPFEPDLDQFVLEDGEKLLICSDGLWGVVDTVEIQRIIAHASNLDQMANQLVQRANDSGGPDNISVILVACMD